MKLENRTWLCCTLVGVLAGMSVAAAENEVEAVDTSDLWLEQAQVDYEVVKQSFFSATNKEARTAWKERLDAAREVLTNAYRLAKLEDDERVVTTQRETGAEHALRRVLTTIDTNVEGLEEMIGSLNADIRKLKKGRTRYETRQAVYEDQRKAGVTPRGDLSLHIRKLDAHLLATMFRRDAAEMRLRLAREAQRIDKNRRELDIEGRITIREVLRKTGDVRQAQKRRDEFSLMEGELESRQSEIKEASHFCQRCIARIDSRLQLLKQKATIHEKTAFLDRGLLRAPERKRGFTGRISAEIGKVFRTDTESQKEIERTMRDSAGKMELMSGRFAHLDAQAEATRELSELVDQGGALFAAEVAYLNAEITALRERYWQSVVLPLSMIVGLIVLYVLMSRAILPLFLKRDSLFVSRRLLGYLLVLLIVVVLVMFFLEDLKVIAAFMGIVTAAIVIALQDACSAFAGWFVIVASRKVRVGDRIEIDDCRGEVIDIQMLRTTLVELNNWLGVDEPTGRTMIVPNSFIFRSKVFNYSHVHPYIWGKVDITVTFETPAMKAHDVLWNVLAEECEDDFKAASAGGAKMEKVYGTAHVEYRPRIHTVIADSGVCFSLFYVCHYRRFSSTKDKLMKRIVIEFGKDPEIEFAYPTERHIPTPEAALPQGDAKQAPAPAAA